jgi:hypothetical protein
MEVEEFLSIPEEDIVYEVPSDDQLMTELVDTFKIAESSNSSEDVDDSTEIAVISATRLGNCTSIFTTTRKCK